MTEGRILEEQESKSPEVGGFRGSFPTGAALKKSSPTGSVVTYSAAYTLVPTYECFNHCSYCNFRQEPGSEWLPLEGAARRLNSLRDKGICEILILSGEVHPRSARRAAWIDRIDQLCQLALEMGFLPHTNAGPLSVDEMTRLKGVNASMGLMLEQVSERLVQTVHRHAPSKHPALRLEQLEQAGRLQIPFTTGLLLGIGETAGERQETLTAIATMHQRYRHIQEVILQPHSRGTRQAEQSGSLAAAELVEIVAIARQILPADITIQIPPNLTSSLLSCLAAGASDLGGIGPKDEVNPDYPHPSPEDLARQIAPAGYELRLRLPVYPRYFSWVPEAVQPVLLQWLRRDEVAVENGLGS